MTSSLKSPLREAFKTRRDALSASEHAKLSHAACEKVTAFAASLARAGDIIAGYAPMRSELDIMPVLKHLSVEHSIALPVTTDAPTLSFRRYHFGDTLAQGRFNIAEPAKEAEIVVPDILLVPLLAFDRQGHRLGWGAGYYDKTLEGLRRIRTITAIGIAFCLQEAPNLSAEIFDQRLNAVITEKEIIRIP